jgi:hypothetical protein
LQRPTCNADYDIALRLSRDAAGVSLTELKNAKGSSGYVSKTRLCSSGDAIHGCLLRVQRCTVGRNQEVSSKVPARVAKWAG